MKRLLVLAALLPLLAFGGAQKVTISYVQIKLEEKEWTALFAQVDDGDSSSCRSGVVLVPSIANKTDGFGFRDPGEEGIGCQTLEFTLASSNYPQDEEIKVIQKFENPGSGFIRLFDAQGVQIKTEKLAGYESAAVEEISKNLLVEYYANMSVDTVSVSSSR